jgi:molybdate transport system permease protein
LGLKDVDHVLHQHGDLLDVDRALVTRGAGGAHKLFPVKVLAASVASLPYCLRTATAAIASVDPGYEEAARVAGTHGVRLAFTVVLPLSRRGIVAGIALAFARALGDFGTTIMIAGNIPGRTQTMPVAVYDRVQAFDYATASMLAAVLATVAIAVLLLVRRLERTRP